MSSDPFAAVTVRKSSRASLPAVRPRQKEQEEEDDPFASVQVGRPKAFTQGAVKDVSPLKIGAPSFQQFAYAEAELPDAPTIPTGMKSPFVTRAEAPTSIEKVFARQLLDKGSDPFGAKGMTPAQKAQLDKAKRALAMSESLGEFGVQGAGGFVDAYGSIAQGLGSIADVALPGTPAEDAVRRARRFVKEDVVGAPETAAGVAGNVAGSLAGTAKAFMAPAKIVAGLSRTAQQGTALQRALSVLANPIGKAGTTQAGRINRLGQLASGTALNLPINVAMGLSPESSAAAFTEMARQAEGEEGALASGARALGAAAEPFAGSAAGRAGFEVLADLVPSALFTGIGGAAGQASKAAGYMKAQRLAREGDVPGAIAAIKDYQAAQKLSGVDDISKSTIPMDVPSIPRKPTQGTIDRADFGNRLTRALEAGDDAEVTRLLKKQDQVLAENAPTATMPTPLRPAVAGQTSVLGRPFAPSMLPEQVAEEATDTPFSSVTIPKRSMEPLTDRPTIAQEVRSVGDNGFVVLPPQAQTDLAVEREHLARMNMEIEPKIQQLAAPYTRAKEGAGLFFGDVSPNALFRFSANTPDEEIRKAAAIRGLAYGQEAQLWYRPAREGEAGASAAFLASARDGKDLSPEAVKDILAAASDNGIVGATKDGGKLSFLNIKEYTGLSDEEFNAKMMAAFKSAEAKHDIDIHETNVYSEILNGTPAYIQAIGPTSESLLAARDAIVAATPEYIRYAKAVGADAAVTEQRIAARLAEIDENLGLQKAVEAGDEKAIQQSLDRRLAQDLGPKGEFAVEEPQSVTSALAGKAFDIGGALGEGVSALSNVPGGKAQIAKVGLGGVGYGLSQAEDERLQAHGNALMGLAAYSLVHGKVKQGAKAAGAAVAQELAKSPAGRRVLDEVSLDIRVDPRVKDAVEVATREMAKYRAVGRELAAEAKKRGGVFDRVVSDLVEKEAVEMGTLSPEDMEIAIALAQKVADNSLGLKKVEARLMSADTYAKRGTAYLPRRYAKYESKDVNDVVVQHKGKTFRISGEKIRNDALTREERDALGEIREASYRIADYFGRGSKDIATAHLFEALSEIPGVIHPEYASAVREAAIAADLSKVARTPTAAYRGSPTAGRDALRAADEAKARAKGLSEQFKRQGQEYVTLPDTPQLGVLRGAVVRKDAADYLNDLPDFKSTNRMYNRLMHYWKSAHTVFNVPATHLTNMASNVFMGILGGLPLQEQVVAIPRALKDIQEYGPTTRFLTEAGIIERALPTYGDTPLKGLARDETVLRSLMKTTRPDTRAALEAQGLKGMGWMEEKARKVGGKIERAYSLGDTMFRVALFDKLTGKGMAQEDALKEVMRVFPGYDTRSPILQKLKHVSPFVMYPAKYLPAALNLIAEHPWRWALASASWAAIDQASRSKAGAVSERDLPENRRFGKGGYLVPGPIQMEALGLKSKEAGKRLMFDMARYTPFTALTGSPAPGTTVSAISEKLPAIAQPSGPIMDIIARLGPNVDPFSGKPFFKKSDEALDKLKKLTVGTTEAGRFTPGLAASLLLPSSLSYHLPNIAKDLYYGNAEAAKMSGAGLLGGRPIAVKRGQQASVENWKLQQQISEINTELQGDLKAARDMVVRRNLIKKAMQKRQRLMAEYTKSRQR